VTTEVRVSAIFNHFRGVVLETVQKHTEADPEEWTLDILSKAICQCSAPPATMTSTDQLRADYPAIGEAIDGDSSGAISILEINSFFNNRKDLSIPVWLA
jgi:hypothetical protein